MNGSPSWMRYKRWKINFSITSLKLEVNSMSLGLKLITLWNKMQEFLNIWETQKDISNNFRLDVSNTWGRLKDCKMITLSIPERLLNKKLHFKILPSWKYNKTNNIILPPTILNISKISKLPICKKQSHFWNDKYQNVISISGTDKWS